MENRRRRGKRGMRKINFILILALFALAAGTIAFLNSRQAKPEQKIPKQPAAAKNLQAGTSSSAKNPAAASTAVTSERLNIRTGVGTQNGTVCSVPANTQLKLTGQANPDSTWVQVETPDGKTGWCCRAFLDVDAVDAMAVQVPVGVAAPLSIHVSLAQQKVIVLDANDKAVKTFTCSSGESGYETPTGAYTIGGRGKSFYNESLQEGAYYWTRFYGDYLFHSIPIDEHYQIKPEEATKLGKTASHGCIRLALKDAKWIYEHIPDNTRVVIQ